MSVTMHYVVLRFETGGFVVEAWMAFSSKSVIYYLVIVVTSSLLFTYLDEVSLTCEFKFCGVLMCGAVDSFSILKIC